MNSHALMFPASLRAARRARGLVWASLTLSLAALAPNAVHAGSSSKKKTTTSAVTVNPRAIDSPGRLLASNCFQCHGTGGTGGFDNIRGGEAEEVREYRDLAREPARQDIMAAHAQGYTDAQIALILQNLKAK
ncbi:hypothetical protein JI742_07770 [Piscinibacter sp. Jin2]|uniref:Cytochrome c domain-containing protein n=1 Tax=Aquariibacter lacus TaxID=2801332 RepID=A0A9X0XDU9_9BURK|nr:hypothetical protein [Piscinibacter lacus]MBL0719784.1 hypothetical protein [Piscinibacter lacus]